jgi:hypothetical protein
MLLRFLKSLSSHGNCHVFFWKKQTNNRRRANLKRNTKFGSGCIKLAIDEGGTCSRDIWKRAPCEDW